MFEGTLKTVKPGTGTGTFKASLFYILVLLSLHLPNSLHGVSAEAPSAGDNLPWFTGPLLTPSARVISPGHVNVEPYLFYTVNTGLYDNHGKVDAIKKFYQINPQLQLKVGVIEDLDFSISPQSMINSTQGRTNSVFGDLPVGIDYQIYEGKKDSYLSYAKFTLQVTLPTGRFDRLNPRNLGTDTGGGGTYSTQIGIGFSKLLEFSETCFMNNRFFIAATLSTDVRVKGLSAYQGDCRTRGKVRPGALYTFLAGTEYTFTKNWTLACDLLITFSDKTSFKGQTITPVGSPSSSQFSIAPAIEYNWSDSLGIIIGPWFTIAGRNSHQFYNIVVAINYAY